MFRFVFFFIDLLDHYNRKKEKVLNIHPLAEFLSEKELGPTRPFRAKWHFVNNDLMYFPFKPFKESLSILAELVHHVNYFLQHWQKLHRNAFFRLETQFMIV